MQGYVIDVHTNELLALSGTPFAMFAPVSYRLFFYPFRFNVLHPMGWDAFGLPAEQYALQTGTHPRDTTIKNQDRFRSQLKMLGFSYDWQRY